MFIPKHSDLAHMCQQSYIQPPTYQAADCFALRMPSEPNTLLLALRGSASLDDWLHDLDAVTVDTAIGIVHQGFYNDSSALYKQHISKLPKTPSLIIGHSKGAGEAGQLVMQMRQDGWPPATVVLFGCPRFVLDSDTSYKYFEDCDVTSYRHGEDPVPEVPPLLEHPFNMTPLKKVMKGLGIVERIDSWLNPIGDHLLGSTIDALLAIDK